MSEKDTTERCFSSPLEMIMRRRIEERLARAQGLVQEGLPAHVEEIQELLRDALDRVAACEVAQLVGAAAETEDNEPCVLAPCALSNGFGKPVTEFLLIPFGDVEVERPLSGASFAFTRPQADAAVNWFAKLNRKLAIDYEHQSFDRFNGREDGLRPAAGWIGGLEVREDGLWAIEIVWTDRAASLLCSGEYRYFSPVIFWADETHTEFAGLGPVALTNDPAMHGVRPLAAGRALGSDADAEVVGDETRNDSLCDSEDHAALEALVAARGRIEALETQLRMQKADGFVERGMRQGKILDSNSMDWRADYLRDAELTEARLRRAPVLVPQGRILSRDARGRVRETTQQIKPDEQTSAFIADLAAYERAS
ncbi:MAG: phage protease, partial [Phycisphaerae bacterium]